MTSPVFRGGRSMSWRLTVFTMDFQAAIAMRYQYNETRLQFGVSISMPCLQLNVARHRHTSVWDLRISSASLGKRPRRHSICIWRENLACRFRIHVTSRGAYFICHRNLVFKAGSDAAFPLAQGLMYG